MSTTYDEAYARWKAWERPFGDYSPEEAAYFAGEVTRCVGIGRKPGHRLLEVGFGNGALLGWARATGWACDGVEVNDVLIARARAAGFSVYRALAEIPPDIRYDLIACMDVFEHIDDAELVTFAATLSRLLRDEGRILVRVPNADSPLCGLYQHGDVTHRSSIGSLKLRQVAQMASLEICSVGVPFVPKGADLLVRSKRTLQQIARSIVEKVISSIYLDGQRVLFHPTLVAVLSKRVVPAAKFS